MTTEIASATIAGLSAGNNQRQKAHLTFRGNIKRGRHGWLRLTPAYSLHVVNEILASTRADELILDPFSGTATTTLASVTLGRRAHSVDVNPFLVWLGNLKVQSIAPSIADEVRIRGQQIGKSISGTVASRWVPNLHQIEKWWDRKTLSLLADLFARVIECDASSTTIDLLKIAFCKVMIATSNASFGHQSMSFKKPRASDQTRRSLFAEAEHECQMDVARLFTEAVEEVADGLATDAPTVQGEVFLGDSRHLDRVLKPSVYSTVITSPPYPNRMSYIRELRPYMYWLGFLESGRQAGELDWQAIGGTWGCATSNLADWQPANGEVSYPHFDDIVATISNGNPLLGKYVHRYFDDIKQHLHSLRKVMLPHGRCFYIVGNSKFYETMLPVEEIYAALFEDAGFTDVGWKAIRKRNSKKELFEYVVHANMP